MKTIVIFAFMVKDLNLKGVELLIYALIYGFSQYGQKCFVKAETMAEAVGCSRAQVFRSLKSLLAHHLIDYDCGYTCRHMEDKDDEIRKDLDNLIRIAKTPWLD